MSTERKPLGGAYTGSDIDRELARAEADVAALDARGAVKPADRAKLAEIDRDLERAESWARGIRAGAAALTEGG